MTKTRIILTGVLGGIAMFFWSFVAHDVLPLGKAGFSDIPNEEAALAAMPGSIVNKAGLYMFPRMGSGSDAMKIYAAKLEKNPSGLLLYHPAGSRPIAMVKFLAVEFTTELLEALLVVFLLAQTRIVSFGGRVGFVITAGILAAIATNISYWNWYGFPAVYVASYMFTQVVGFFLVGLVAAFMFRRVTA
jgi:hypothetical protein